MIEAVFVNSGVLGQKTFAKFIDRYLVNSGDDIRTRQIIVSDNLSFSQKVRRRLTCARFVPGNLRGFRNADFFHFRAEWNAGVTVAEKIDELEKSAGVDVLHFHRQGTAYRSLDRMARIPSIVSIDCTQGMRVDSAANSFESLTYKPNARRDGKVFAAAKLIISTSEWAARCLRREYPDCKTDIAVRPNPVEINAFSADLPARRLDQSGSSPAKVEVLFIGGDFERKGGLTLLDAWQKGGFSEVANLRIVTDRDVPRRPQAGVEWFSDVESYNDQWLNLWRNAEVFVLPTREDPFPNVFQEAAAAGLPSIGTRITSIPEIVVDGETGLLIERDNVAELIRALRVLIESPEIRHRIGTAARRRIEQRADPIEYADFLTESIRQLAARR